MMLFMPKCKGVYSPLCHVFRVPRSDTPRSAFRLYRPTLPGGIVYQYHRFHQYGKYGVTTSECGEARWPWSRALGKHFSSNVPLLWEDKLQPRCSTIVGISKRVVLPQNNYHRDYPHRVMCII